uniref:replication initiation protein n=1 Tax=Escherichia coli TaxID=562 RepID=UPI00133082D1
MSDLIAYKSNALVEASYKLTLQEQRFLLLCISRLKLGADAASSELQKNLIITAEEYFNSFPDMGRKNAEIQLQEAVDRLWDRWIFLKDKRRGGNFG